VTSFLRRIITASLFIPCLLVILHHGGLALVALVDLIILVALLEFYDLARTKGVKPLRTLGICAAFLVSWSFFPRTAPVVLIGLVVLLLVVSLALEAFRRRSNTILEDISTTVFGVLYIGLLTSHLIALRQLPLSLNEEYSRGMSYALLPFFVTWFGDTGAYLVGVTRGRHKLIPRISPNKSIEGTIAGLVTSVLVTFWARAWFAPYLRASDCLILGGLLGVVALAGDLSESLLKRDVKVKDSAGTIPGHGGALDRFDSLLFNIPLVYYYLVIVVFH
jgi:phosphatidate cytidylyltransferase